MATMRSRHDPGRIFFRRAILLGLFGLILFGSWSVWGASRKEQESAALNQQSQAALTDLSSQQQKLQANITDLQSERGREAALRQQYAVGATGEGLVVIIDPATTTPAPPAPSMMDKIKKAFWWW